MSAILIEFIPIVAFFIVYKLHGIYLATIVCIACMVLQMLYNYFTKGKVENSQLIALAVIVILGGTTVWLHNELFIKWKPTVLYWIFSSLFLFSPWIFKQPLAEKILNKNITLAKDAWKKLNTMCAMFFAFMGFLNLWVVYNFNTDVWVNFKLFGSLGLTLVFTILVGLFVQKNSKIKE